MRHVRDERVLQPNAPRSSVVNTTPSVNVNFPCVNEREPGTYPDRFKSATMLTRAHTPHVVLAYIRTYDAWL